MLWQHKKAIDKFGNRDQKRVENIEPISRPVLPQGTTGTKDETA